MFWAFAVIVFVMDVGTGLPVALKTRALKSIYLKKPSIILGDMLIIPLVGGFILNHFYSTRQSFIESFSVSFLTITAAVAIVLALISAIRFKTTSPWYWPHGVFYVFMAFWILLFLIGKFDLTSVAWWLVLVGIGVHLYLGKKYPKVFPKIK